jgi:outer membrane protein assembly factor BamB
MTGNDRRMRSAGIAALLVVAAAGSANAAATKVFRQTSAKDFEEGEATGSMILPTGEVVAGMKTTHVPLDAAFVWCAAQTRDGQTAYFGTGDQGKIFAVDTKAPHAGDEKPARKVADLDAAWVTALAVRNDGTLLAGTTPGGRIYSVDPKTGNAHEWTTLSADHVWSLAYDARTGVTYAGTGSPGKVFAIDDKGHARELWDSGDKHVVSLAQEPGGTRALLAGTSEEAILYRVSLEGRAEALQDFEAEEVRAIAPTRDAIYVAVNDFEKGSPPAVGGPVAAKGTRIMQTAGAPSSAGSLPRPGQRKAKAGLYRFERDGRVEQIFSLGDGYLTAVLPDPDGTPGAVAGSTTGEGGVFVATGTQGKVYRVYKDRTAALALDLPERQVLALVRAGVSFLAGTGDIGGVYRAQPSAGEDASYLSKVLDGEFPSRWGMLRWHGTQNLVVETRSGNTAKPDASWNAWRKLDRLQAGNDESAGHVASLGARYLQYRVGLGSAGARLRDVSIYYVPQNQRARVTELTLADPSPPSSSGSSSSVGSRVHSPVLKLRWKVDNADGDDLNYRLAYREENEVVWRPLGGPDPLQKPEYDWNTEAIPDGNYTVRVLTSDERSRPRSEALESTFISPPLLVDNRKPEILGLDAAHYPQVTGRARDTGSNITEIEFAVDGGDWQLVPPNDGIFDDRVEPFAFQLPTLPAGPHNVTVRAWDSADNVGAAAITVRTK